ncbi:restriction endonuclease [Sphaerospermopsis sp. LEGE 00249]|uniref:McrC family protein n=1 Tax=Sphaerospermopsis sp. LEGE 00249 TaxID=1380707 RepID=UPI00164EABBE|nr:restriction endonuclease [Sphaerospermopsis sp. LEGE 00249]MBC5795949.1 restriction endonuclease [Sphaerospermopsis sp. LEGE 00249]
MNSENLQIIEITEYQNKYFSHNEISEEYGITLYEKYKNQVDVEFPSYKTRYQWKLTAKGWVGYIPVNFDFALKINPKVPIKNLFGMLEYAYNLKSFKFLDGLMTCDSVEDFYNQLADILAEKIIERCRKGLYRSYVPKTEKLTYVRGRLNVQEIIKKPWDVKLQCTYQEHTADIIDNQILFWTLFHIGHSGCCSDKVSQIVRKAYHAMQGMVSLKICDAKDCLERNYHRLSNDYYTLHQLCRFFLDNSIPSHEHGQNTSLPFLVNMAKLYEMFVAEWLRENLPPHLTLKTQERIIIDKNIYFQTDLIIYDAQTLTPKYILDTKYKNPENISKNDLAQVVAYAVSKHCSEAVLVYPTVLNNPFNQYVGNIKIRGLNFSLDDNLEDGGKAFLKQLFS